MYSNQAFAKISGYSKKELLSLTPSQVEKIIHPDHRALVWGRMRARLQGQKAVLRYEFKGFRKDGSVRWMEMVANRIEFEGKPAVLGALIDITERKKAEENLKESGVINDYELKLLAKDGRVIDVFLDINKAIPCGLIINELVSHSLKHAFPQNKKGNVYIQLSAGNNGNVRLEVSDDGIGFSEKVDFQEPDSLGLQLVNDLVEQLGGTLKLDSSSGTSYQISFSA